MRLPRLELYTLPDYLPRKNRDNEYGFDPQEQANHTYTGMGEDINVHDQWAVESMGPIADRTREHLATTDKAIIAYRRMLLRAIDDVAAGGNPPLAPPGAGLRGPGTIDAVGPVTGWQDYWREQDALRRAGAPWMATALQTA
jgi:hypothetical protein